MGILADIATQASGDLIKTGMQYYANKNLARQDQANYRKNLKLAAALDITNQRKAIEQSVTALRNAGLSPALAANGNFSAPAVSAALGNTSVGMPGTDLGSVMSAHNQREILDEQKENIKSLTNANNAAANKYNAEAEEVEQRKISGERENLRTSDYDKTINESMREYYKVMAKDDSKSQAERDYYETLANSINDFSRGTLQAQREFATFINELDEYQKEAVLRALTTKITQMQLRDEPTLEALAFAPKTLKNKMLAETADTWSSKKWRDWQRESLGPAQAELLGTESQVKRHSDFVGMVDDGNYFGAAMYLLPSLLTGLGSAAIYGRMIKGSEKVAKKAAQKTTQNQVDEIFDNLPKNKASTPVFEKVNNDRPHLMNKPSQHEMYGKLIHENKQTFNSVRASLGEKNTKALYDRYMQEHDQGESFKHWLSREKPILR